MWLAGIFATPDSNRIGGTTFLSLTVFAFRPRTSRCSIRSPDSVSSCAGSCDQRMKGWSVDICFSAPVPGLASRTGGPASTEGSSDSQERPPSSGAADLPGGAPRRQNTSVSIVSW